MVVLTAPVLLILLKRLDYRISGRLQGTFQSAQHGEGQDNSIKLRGFDRAPHKVGYCPDFTFIIKLGFLFVVICHAQ